jgi:hypothetical protein
MRGGERELRFTLKSHLKRVRREILESCTVWQTFKNLTVNDCDIQYAHTHTYIQSSGDSLQVI